MLNQLSGRLHVPGEAHDPSGTPSPSDVEIEAKLKAAPDDLWMKLWTVAEELPVNEAPATWAGGKPVQSAGETVIQMPYVVYAEPVNEIVDLFYQLGVMVPSTGPNGIDPTSIPTGLDSQRPRSPKRLG
jgi:hypothetical protein